MTSNTAPSGVCSASNAPINSSATFDIYKAFDGNGITRYSSELNPSNPSISYKFTNPVCVKKIYLDSYVEHLKNFKIQASNDQSSWVDLYSGINNSMPISIGDNYQEHRQFTTKITNNDYYLYYLIIH